MMDYPDLIGALATARCAMRHAADLMIGRASPWDEYARELRNAALIIDDWLKEIRRLPPKPPAVMAFTPASCPAPAHAATEALSCKRDAERQRSECAQPPIAVGDRVCYHSIIGGPVTSMGHTVVQILRAPNPFGTDVAWITGKAACVALDALSRPQPDAAVAMRRYERMAEDLIHWIVEQRLFQACCAVDDDHGVVVTWGEHAVEHLAARLARGDAR